MEKFTWSALAIYALLRFIDAILPSGHHLRLMDRWLKHNKEDKDEPTTDDGDEDDGR